MSDNEKPWLNEPDSLRFVDELTGLECYIWRHTTMGHLNGYVIIPKNNRLYGINYNDKIFDQIEVHGGITFSDIIEDIDEYAIGFDCAHVDDISPKMSICISGDTYKDIEFVKAECRSLARQLAELLINMRSVNAITTTSNKINITALKRIKYLTREICVLCEELENSIKDNNNKEVI